MKILTLLLVLLSTNVNADKLEDEILAISKIGDTADDMDEWFYALNSECYAMAKETKNAKFIAKHYKALIDSSYKADDTRKYNIQIYWAGKVAGTLNMYGNDESRIEDATQLYFDIIGCKE
jgi:site-specific recombinase